MASTNHKQAHGKSSNIARDALHSLALSRIAPAPDNTGKLYREIPGSKPGPNPSTVLEDLASDLRRYLPGSVPALNDLEKCIRRGNWAQCSEILHNIISNAAAQGMGDGVTNPVSPVAVIDLLVQTLEFSVAPRVAHIPRLSAELKIIIENLRHADSAASLKRSTTALKKFWRNPELQQSANTSQQEALKNLLLQLLENISELVEEDSWLSGQIEIISKTIAGPLNTGILQEAERRLKEVIFKQGHIKYSLREATCTLNDTMKTFISRMAEAMESTGDYRDRISVYADRIRNTEDAIALNRILESILKDTRNMQEITQKMHEALMGDRRTVEQAEFRIQELEAELVQMSALVSEDPMTHSLNRRGMSQEYARETSRAMRNGSPLCVVILDIDNFKKLNDSRGHLVGDEALIHLVRIAKQICRASDVIARVGGEEFMILLPDTTLKNAVLLVTRLQRALTKKFLLGNNERILITFSAGAALYEAGESQESIMSRADKALYQAKHTGKNRVCIAKPGAATVKAKSAVHSP